MTIGAVCIAGKPLSQVSELLDDSSDNVQSFSTVTSLLGKDVSSDVGLWWAEQCRRDLHDKYF